MMQFKQGIISEWKPGYARVVFPEDKIVSDWLQIVYPFTLKDKVIWPLAVEEQVACLMDANLENGVVLGATYNKNDVPPEGASGDIFEIQFEDETKLRYDKSIHALVVDVQGSVKVKALTTAEVECPEITLKGNVAVLGTLSAGALAIAAIAGVSGADGTSSMQGNLAVNGDVNAHGDVRADTVSLLTHVHGGVTPGSGSTSTPV